MRDTLQKINAAIDALEPSKCAHCGNDRLYAANMASGHALAKHCRQCNGFTFGYAQPPKQQLALLKSVQRELSQGVLL